MKKRGLPDSVCLRVTRKCNSRCLFCLAPPVGEEPTPEVLIQRIDWLLHHGVQKIHFCGGEPTMFPGLSGLLAHVHNNRGKIRLTTNGVSIEKSLVEMAVRTSAEVKVSLHGDQDHHERMSGVATFRRTLANITMLKQAGVRVSIQSVLVGGKTGMLDWLIDFSLRSGIRRLSILPFQERGRGSLCKESFGLSFSQRAALREEVKEKRRSHTQLDLRYIDFSSRPFVVLDTDGRLLNEYADERRDEILFSGL